MMDKLTPEQRRKNMQAVKNKGSQIERTMAKILRKEGFRYRKNDKTVFGKPDFTFKRLKIAVFADSEFWHGKDWEKRKYDHKSNREFWVKKIERNIERDREVNAKLTAEGWLVLRFWGKEILKNPELCAEKVKRAIIERRKSMKQMLSERKNCPRNTRKDTKNKSDIKN